MSNTNANFEITGILSGQEVRKRKTPQEKITIIQHSDESSAGWPGIKIQGAVPASIFNVAESNRTIVAVIT